MPFDKIIKDYENHLKQSHETLAKEFGRIRTGRASPQLIEHVRVDAYGTPSPITQVAGITVPEPTQLLIKPWDKGLLHAIEKALVQADLGMTPTNDGSVIRILIPPLSAERRKQLATQAKEAAEKIKVAMRNARRDAIKHLETTAKDENTPEDTLRATTDKVTKILKDAETKVDKDLKTKVDAITTM